MVLSEQGDALNRNHGGFLRQPRRLGEDCPSSLRWRGGAPPCFAPPGIPGLKTWKNTSCPPGWGIPSINPEGERYPSLPPPFFKKTGHPAPRL